MINSVQTELWNDPGTIAKLRGEIGLKKDSLGQVTMARGGVDSGGGTIVNLHDGRTVLLDTYLYSTPSPKLLLVPRSQVPQTMALQSLGIDRLVIDDFFTSTKWDGFIKTWKPSSPILISYVERALRNLPIYILDGEFNFQDKQFHLPPGIKGIQSVETAAFYVQDFGVFISKKLFEKLAPIDQIGLLIHEALRHAQITYRLKFSNERLQKLTAALLRSPKSGESLDSEEYLDGGLLLELLSQVEIRLAGFELRARVCRFYQIPLHDQCSFTTEMTMSEVNQAMSDLGNYIGDPDNPIETRKEWYAVQSSLAALAYQKSNLLVKGASLSAVDSVNEVRKSLSSNALVQLLKRVHTNNRITSKDRQESQAILTKLKDSGFLR